MPTMDVRDHELTRKSEGNTYGVRRAGAVGQRFRTRNHRSSRHSLRTFVYEEIAHTWQRLVEQKPPNAVRET